MRKVIVMFALSALATGRSALADDMSYSFLQLDVQGGELDGGNYGTLSGYALHGSVEVGPHVYLFGDYGNTKYAGNGVKARFLPGTVGLGGHVAFSPNVEAYGGVSAERLTIRTGVVGLPDPDTRTSDTFKGWGIQLAARGWIGESFQWSLGVKRRDLKDLEKINSISLGGRFYFRRAWAVGMDYTYQKYENHIIFGRDSLGALNVRYTFGGY
jgi:hypothetical protein